LYWLNLVEVFVGVEWVEYLVLLSKLAPVESGFLVLILAAVIQGVAIQGVVMLQVLVFDLLFVGQAFE
jgi:hypothetical protein